MALAPSSDFNAETNTGQFEKFWVLNFGIAAKAHFKKSAILLWRIHRIEWLK
jgi:hypothetical protein